MDRRAFLKVLLVTLPTLYLDPAACLCIENGNAYAVEQPDPDLSIFFVGDYGRRILQEYRNRRLRYPVQVPTMESIGLDINEEGEVILTKEGPITHDALPEARRSKLGIFVLDARAEKDLSIAEDLCRQISHERMARTICLTPEWPKRSLIGTPINLVLVTKSKVEDLAVPVLLTLNNTFLGYDTAGEYQQLTHLLDMMALGSSRYLMQAGVGRITERLDPDTDARRLFEQAYRHVGQPTRETKIFGILEASEVDELITDVFSGAYAVARKRLQVGDAPMTIVFHEGLAYPEARLTLFRIVDEVSPEA
ncbi:MAG: hypothetical protein AB2L22_09750 [Syntrophales bacterium]|jgi:hypothetical protein